MYRVHVRRHFDAAHALRGYKGKCENLHGHRWEVVACVRSSGLNDIGLAYDYGDLKHALDGVLDGLDHRNLCETPPFDQLNPSSEHIARTVYAQLKARLQGVELLHVQVYESPDAWVTYQEDD